jgi:hypothetical protein
MVTGPEGRPPIGPVLREITDLLTQWWLGFDVTKPAEPLDDAEDDSGNGSDPRQSRQLGEIIPQAEGEL